MVHIKYEVEVESIGESVRKELVVSVSFHATDTRRGRKHVRDGLVFVRSVTTKEVGPIEGGPIPEELSSSTLHK